MAIKFLNKTWNLELRSGIGFDIELANARPCFIFKTVGDDEPVISPAVFEGLVISLPLMLILIGECYEY